MKLLYIALCAFLLCSCGGESATTQKMDSTFDPSLIVGQWWLDSSSYPRSNRDKLFILEDGSVYKFSGTDGGSMRKFRKLTFDTIITEYDEKLFVAILDSNRIIIKGGYSVWEEIYRRVGELSDLADHVAADSLRNHLLGWWQSDKAEFPLNVVNDDGFCTAFTINIRADGEVDFYADHQFDSVTDYTYQMTRDGFWATKGCVVSDISVFPDTGNNIKMYWNGLSRDTFHMTRLKIIKQ